MTIYLGQRRVELLHLGRAHTAGDIVAWVPDAGVMYTGDIVGISLGLLLRRLPFRRLAGDLDAIAAYRPDAIAPGRGDALVGPAKVAEAIALTRDFPARTCRSVAQVAARGGSLKDAMQACREACDAKFSSYAIYEHCLPFNVARALMRRSVSIRPASGPRSAIRSCGTPCRDQHPHGAVDYKPFSYRTPPELSGGPGRRWPVLIVGAGPIGLAAAIDLALHGIAYVVLDDNNVVSRGSRAICWSKRTLEIFDRLGVGERMVKKGVTWKVGRLYHRDREVYSFDLLPEAGHKNPAFINLQQYYVEQFLIERCYEFPELIELRFKNKVAGVKQFGDGVAAEVETPDGRYAIQGDYLIACDGAKSGIRAMLGAEFKATIFPEQFLITDVEMKADFPSERWFWFERTFHNGQSALLHHSRTTSIASTSNSRPTPMRRKKRSPRT